MCVFVLSISSGIIVRAFRRIDVTYQSGSRREGLCSVGQEPHTTLGLVPRRCSRKTYRPLLLSKRKPCGRCSIRRKHLHFHDRRLLEKAWQACIGLHNSEEKQLTVTRSLPSTVRRVRFQPLIHNTLWLARFLV
ncbi:unnamed protein product, partial [Ectocarpus sp. 12 AP-2014]